MTPYTIALAGKAYLTKEVFFGRIQQLTGTAPSNLKSSDLSLSLVAKAAPLPYSFSFKSLPYPYSIGFLPKAIGTKQNKHSQFPGIRNNFSFLAAVFNKATTGLRAAQLCCSRLILDTVYPVASLDVIVSKSYSDRGNYKLMPVLIHSAR